MRYKINGHQYDSNSSTNQRIMDSFVAREVLACISDLADYLIDYNGEKYASFDDFFKYYEKVCSECENTDGFEEDKNNESETIWRCNCCNQVLSNKCYEALDTEPREVFEWWIVTPWLGEKLKNNNEVVLERWGGWIWGRGCSGQAISLDPVISEICFNMEILEGQGEDWGRGVA